MTAKEILAAQLTGSSSRLMEVLAGIEDGSERRLGPERARDQAVAAKASATMSRPSSSRWLGMTSGGRKRTTLP